MSETSETQGKENSLLDNVRVNMENIQVHALEEFEELGDIPTIVIPENFSDVYRLLTSVGI